ncbi:MAG: ribosome small subunit-dependent GTPase A [Chitinophagales bacterium]
MKVTVIKSTGSWYEAIDEHGQLYLCRLKGVLRLDETRDTNPVAVGDVVVLVKEDDDWMISEVTERRNYIVRASPKHKGARQIIAANLDQCLLIVTMANPRTSSGFIDRFLMTAEAYHVPTILIFNKQDALDPKSLKKQNEMAQTYSNIGYSVHFSSAIEKKGTAELLELLKGRTSLLAGHSGVGKSSLMNAIDPSLNLKTTEVSRITGKGMHTTTFAEMHFTSFGGRVIDTPGVREFGIKDFLPEEISHYFVEMRALLPQCKFNNCLHENEPGCAVKEAFYDGRISEARYVSYINILEDYRANFKHWE